MPESRQPGPIFRGPYGGGSRALSGLAGPRAGPKPDPGLGRGQPPQETDWGQQEPGTRGTCCVTVLQGHRLQKFKPPGLTAMIEPQGEGLPWSPGRDSPAVTASSPCLARVTGTSSQHQSEGSPEEEGHPCHPSQGHLALLPMPCTEISR